MTDGTSCLSSLSLSHSLWAQEGNLPCELTMSFNTRPHVNFWALSLSGLNLWWSISEYREPIKKLTDRNKSSVSGSLFYHPRGVRTEDCPHSMSGE